MEEQNTRRIVVLGKTGSGKSSIANNIFGGERVFKVNTSANSGTKICQSNIKEVNGRNIQLIDTPGLFDTDPDSTEMSPEILRCIIECAPGPHAFLLVLKVERFTKQEQAVVDIILKYFSEEALKYTTVVFTHGDDLPEGVKIKEWVRENKALRNLVEKCGGRCHVFDNKYWNNSQDQYRNNQVQVKELLKTIDKTVKENGGEYYTNEKLQFVHEEIQKEAKHSKASSPNSSQEDNHKEAKNLVYTTLISISIVGAAILLGALLGGGVGLTIGALKAAGAAAGAGGAGAAGGAVVALGSVAVVGVLAHINSKASKK